MGKRYISMYSAQAFHDEHALLAEGLTDGTHAVRIQPTNSSYGGGPDRRAYVTGVAGVTGVSGGATPDQSANHSMVYVREPYNGRSSYSAMVSAIEFNSNDNFLGEVHGNESQAGFAWYVDGRAAWPALGGYASGTVIRGALASTLHNAGYVSAVAEKTSDYFFSAYQRDACRVLSKIVWRTAGIGQDVYHGMLPIGKGNRHATSTHNAYVPYVPYIAYFNDEFDAIYFGSTSVTNINTNNGGWDGDTQTADKATFYQSGTAHATRARLRIDKAKNVNDYAAIDATIHFANQDRADGLDKVYAVRSMTGAEEAYEVGAVHESDTGFHVFRQSDTNPDSEQDT